MSFSKALRTSSVSARQSIGNEDAASSLITSSIATSRRTPNSMIGGPRQSDWRYSGARHAGGIGAGGPLSTTSSRPSTCSSIVNMLITKKKQGAAASHLIDKNVPQNVRHRAVAEKALDMTVKNLMVRNPKLPVDLVRKLLGIELSRAMQNGRLYTAKELNEIEEKVFAEVNLRVSHGQSIKNVR